MYERIMKWTAVVTFALVLFGVVNPALAQRVTPCNAATPNNALCVEGTPPTTTTDGLPIVNALTYRLEQRIGTGAWTTVNTLAVPRFYVTNLAPGAYTFRMYAIAGGLESAASNTVTKDATPLPTPPTAPVITIAVVISPDAPPHIVTVNGDQVYASARP